MKVILLSLLIALGCHKQYDLDACNDLSMKKFKGFTDAKEKFAKNCTQFAVKYTEELCQSAFNELIFSQDLSKVKAKYGDPVEGCFLEHEIKKHDKTK